MQYSERDDAWGHVTRPREGQEPYIRITLPDGTTADGQARAWTQDKVYALWVTGHAFEDRHLAWMDATDVKRIHRSESNWTDPYDDSAFHYPDLPRDSWA
ncbi:hypothetical protein [Citricoccus sp.]|uniref:hypothetical protein n=1 Tax=Citricoccus sp. TaxID=1978372 RepID=UPI0028BDE6A2|nr:hypothetical protein [Citricoccus sp.]